MSKFLQSSISTIILFFIFAAHPVLGQFSGDGSGTESDPYIITNLEQLQEMNNDLAAHYKMVNSISAGWDSNDLNDGDGYEPIGNVDDPFTGYFDGGGYQIRLLIISRPDANGAGVFGIIEGATIRNIGIENIEVEGDINVGGLVGGMLGGLIENSYVHNNIYTYEIVGNTNVGSLIGVVTTGSLTGVPEIRNTYGIAPVIGNQSVGYFIGIFDRGNIYSSFHTTSYNHISDATDGIGADPNTFNTVELEQLTASQMNRLEPFYEAGWDFKGEVGNGAEGIWNHGNDEDRFTGYPYLSNSYPDDVPPDFTDYLEGEGTEQDPYLVSHTDHLIWMSEYDELWDKHFQMTSDVDAEVTELINDGLGFRPITSGADFTGTFDGNGHSIENLYINRDNEDNVGLFSSASGAVITNLGLENTNISGRSNTGGLVGLGSNILISNSFVIGTISGEMESIGGLTGSIDGGTIYNSYTNVSVDGGSNIGGFAGLVNGNTDISYSYSSSFVNIDGGFIGSNNSSGSLTNNFWDTTKNVTGIGSGSADGIEGKTESELQEPLTFFNSGWDFKGEVLNGTDNIWNIGNARNEGLPYLAWQYPEDPESLNLSPEGDGSETSPYLITDVLELQWIGTHEENKALYFRLNSDIDASITEEWNHGAGFKPISSEYAGAFEGFFDGNEHTISNLYINRPDEDNVGLFGKTENAEIFGFALTDVSVMGADYVGGLVGNSESGTIDNFYVTGLVNGQDYTGGVVGRNESQNILSNSYSTVGVEGNEFVGGIAGFNNATVLNTYAIGEITAGLNGGILIGRNTNSVENSFWDSSSIESGIGSNTGITDGTEGKSNEEFTRLQTYLEASWDFIDESENGQENVWGWNPTENGGTPFLSFQDFENVVIPEVLSIDPEINSDRVPLGSEITVTFDHEMLITDEDLISIIFGDDEQLPVTSASIFNAELTITADFENFTEYTVLIEDGAVENNGGAFAEDISWSFTTIKSAPVVESEIPANESDRVAIDAEIKLVFNQDVTAGNLFNIEIQDGEGQNVNGVSGNLENNELSISYDSFSNTTEYTVTIQEGTVLNADEVVNETFSWTFTTILKAPVAINPVPEDGTTAVAVDSDINISFNQNVFAEDLSLIEVRDDENQLLDGVSGSLNDNLLIISNSDFIRGTEYTVNIPEGTVSNEEDVINEAFSWSFRSLLEKPVITNRNPTDGEEFIPIDFMAEVSFNQDVIEGDLSNIRLTAANAANVSLLDIGLENNTITIEPSGTRRLDNDIEYRLEIPENTVLNEDGLGNEASSWTFRTIMDSPDIAERIPSRNETRVDLNQDIIVEFDQDITEVDFSGVEIKNIDEDDKFVDNISVTLIDNTLTITHDELEKDTRYRVEIPRGTVKNDEDVENLRRSWLFTTTIGKPQIVRLSPDDGEVGVRTDQSIFVDLKLEVTEVDLSLIEIIDENNNSVAIETIEIQYPGSSIVDSRIHIFLDEDLNEGTIYTVNVPSGVVENSEDLTNEEINWSFTSIFPAPALISSVPEAESTGADVNDDIVISFDQDISPLSINSFGRINANPSIPGKSVHIDGSDIIISHDGMERWTEYTIDIPENTVINSDAVRNEVESIKFTTIQTKPIAETKNPDDGNIGFPVSDDISIAFNQDIFERDLTGIQILDNNENEVPGITSVIEDNVLTISHDTFDIDSEYTVIIPESTVENRDGLGNEEFSWSFTSAMEELEVVSLFPEEDAEHFPVSGSIMIEFNQNISIGENYSDIRVTDENGDRVRPRRNIIDDNILELSIDWNQSYEYESRYEVLIPADAVQKADGIGNTEMNWFFTTAETGPVAINQSPEDGTRGVGLDSVITVTFDQELFEANKSNILIEVGSSSTIDVEDVTFDGNTVSISHTGFRNSFTYTVTLKKGSVLNIGESPNEEVSWSFRAIDADPIPESTFPEDGSESINTDTDIIASFDRSIEMVDLSGIYILDHEGNRIDDLEIEFRDQNSDQLIITDNELKRVTEYTVVLPDSAFVNEDGIYNEMYSWSFSTIANAPVVENEYPANGAELVGIGSLEVKIPFNVDVVSGDLSNIYVVFPSGITRLIRNAEVKDNVLVFTVHNLHYLTSYSIEIPEGTVETPEGVKNEDYELSFKTTPQPLIITETNPEDGFENAEMEGSVEITFNREIFATDFDGIQFLDAEDNPIQSYSAEISDKQLVLSYEELERSNEYTILFPEALINDEHGLTYEAFSFHFSTIDGPPQVVSSDPVRYSSGFPINKPIRITFNQDITEGDLSELKINRSFSSETRETEAIIEGRDLIVTFDRLDFNTRYSLSIEGGEVVNELGEENERYAFQFVTMSAAVVVEDQFPEDSASGVALDEDIILSFDQDVEITDVSGIEILDDSENPVSGINTILADNQLIISHDGFSRAVTYTVHIPEGVVIDDVELANKAISWSFTTILADPVVQNVNPKDDSINVFVDSELKVGFDQNIEAVDVSGIQILDSEDQSVGVIDVEIEDNQMIITHENFNMAQEYTVNIPRGVVSNTEGALNESHSWSFTTVTSEPPVAENATPADGAEEIALDPEIHVSFNQDVEAIDLSEIEIRSANRLSVSGISVELENNQLIISYNSLEPGTQYIVTIPEKVVENTNEIGNPSYSWSFTTISGPIAENKTPESGAKRIALDAEISVSFDIEVEESNLSGIEILDDENEPLAGVSAELVGKELAINNDGFENFTTYTIVIPEGVVTSDKEIENESMSWSFTTVMSAPIAENVTPEDGSEQIPIDSLLTVSFNQDITESNLSEIVITDNNDQVVPGISIEIEENKLVIEHDSFQNLTEYTVTIPEDVVINSDEIGNESMSWSFTTMMSAPIAENVTPEDGAEQITIDSLLTVTFDQEVTAGDLGNIEIHFGDEQSVTNIDAKFENDTLSISHGGFQNSTEYTVLMPEGTVFNAEEIANESYSWSFTTIIEKPEIVALQSPKADTVNVAISPEFVWNESERADLYQIMISEDADFSEIVVDSTQTDITFQMIADLDFDSDYFWKVRASNDGGTSDWSDRNMFTTIVEKPKVVALQSPKADSINVEITPEFVWNQSERADLYQIMISADVEFTEIVMDSTNADTTFQISDALDHDSDYFWKVRASNVGGQSAWSDTTMFTTIIDKPEAIVLMAPESNAEDVMLLPEFIWEEESRTESYEFQLALDAEFEELLVDSTDIKEFTLAISDELETATTYFWQVRGVNISGEGDWSEIGEFTTIISTSIEGLDLPGEITLRNNYPNPFNPTTNIVYGLPIAEQVHIEVFNVLGQRVATLVNEHKGPGWHTVAFDARRLSSGVYIYRMHAGEFVQTETMMLVK